MAFVLAPALLAGAAGAQCALQKLYASNGGGSDQFGGEVALDSTVLFTGAWFEDGAAMDAGRVYVFEPRAAGWLEVQQLTASDATAGDRFGKGLVTRGGRVLVGAFQATAPSALCAGAAYVFERSGGVWVETVKLTGSETKGEDRFGRALALSTDGARAVVTAAHHRSRRGAAYVFEESGGVWTETDKLLASDGIQGDVMGKSVALSGDTILLGAFTATIGGEPRGAAYVYDLVGTSWVESAKLVAADGALDDGFGIRCALRGDVAVVGAFKKDDAVGADAGAAYVFTRTAGVWDAGVKLVPSDPAPDQHFGSGIRLSEDGSRLVISAIGDDDRGARSGSVYVFDLVGTSWVESAKLVPIDGVAGQEFGVSVDLVGDQLAIGAFNDPDLGMFVGTGAGAVYRYSLMGLGCPTLVADRTAVSLATGGTQALTLDAGAGGAGAAYVLAGSLSGFDPGFTAAGALVALNPDAYMQALMLSPGAPPLFNGIGTLDANGRANASIVVPAGAVPTLAGSFAHHTFVALDPLAGTVLHASNPLVLALTF